MKTFLYASLILCLSASLFFLNDCSSSAQETVAERPVSVSDEHEALSAEVRSAEDETLILNISPQRMNHHGYHTGDMIEVAIKEKTFVMPIVLAEEAEKPFCLFVEGERNKDLVALYLEETVEDTGSVFIDLQEKQGHAQAYPKDEAVYRRSSVREDYPQLQDEDYANFRMVQTSGMREGILYRSSSPFDPKIKRNAYADAAAKKAGVRTVIDLADHPYIYSLHEGVKERYASSCDLILLDLSTFYATEEFEKGLVKGLRFLMEQEGPYLIHCTEGKDRTGFVCAILECLTGASVEEVVADYMKTYENYYGIKLGTFVYDRTVKRNLLKDLGRAFQSEDLFKEDLRSCAEAYLEKIGLSEEEVGRLKEKLS
ncbi:MAG: tyrosine-protein phosphatase [Erysipelotrichaceae bacterium]|nr:tyrosine-protein phosphatase [Erysipelotrichaceae bacterium]